MSRKEEYESYLKTERWTELREQALERDGHRCRVCNDPAREVHHRYYPEELGLETVDALTSLCRFCHERYHKPLELLNVGEEVLHKAAKGGTKCPVCTQHVQVYRRALTRTMARGHFLIWQFFQQNPNEDMLHVEDYMKTLAVSASVRGDLAKLRFFGLIEFIKGKRADGSSRNGFYRITKNGKAFVEQGLKVPSYVILFNNRLVGVSEKLVSLDEALDGSDFDYRKLMNVHVPDMTNIA